MLGGTWSSIEELLEYTKVARIYNSLTPKIQKNSLRNFRFGWRKA
jgi:hypothetical protein